MIENIIIAAVVYSCMACSASEVWQYVDNQDTGGINIDDVFKNMLFTSGKGNVTGADGSISVPLPNGVSVFLWGDSFYGDVNGNTRSSTAPFISGNSLSVVYGTRSFTITGGTCEAPTTLFAAIQKDDKRTVLWPEHGFYRNGRLYLFYANIVITGNGTFDFYWHSLDFLTIDAKDFNMLKRQNMPSASMDSIHYGFGCIDEGEYIFTYGTRDDGGISHLYLARFPFNDKTNDIGPMEFWSGSEWTTNSQKSVPLSSNMVSVSEQFSVFKYKDKYILITQERGTDRIYSYVAPNAYGPWKKGKCLYRTPEMGLKKGWITYNAMAHHQYIRDGKLLISYCVNTLDLGQLWTDVESYRPRFFYIDLDTILK